MLFLSHSVNFFFNVSAACSLETGDLIGTKINKFNASTQITLPLETKDR